jgi:hypothetical protein
MVWKHYLLPNVVGVMVLMMDPTRKVPLRRLGGLCEARAALRHWMHVVVSSSFLFTVLMAARRESSSAWSQLIN